MAKPLPILVIEPQHELKFRGPFNAPVTSYMKITNPSDQRICFKIKTTAPKKYCVRPNSGILDPKMVTDIAVSLQPFDFDPSEKNKHKFMVQSIVIPEGEVNPESLWKQANPNTLMDTKLKCVFEMEVSSSTAAPHENSVDASPAVQEDKTKRIGDGTGKSSPKPAVNIESELIKAAAEVKHLREEESSLRQENLQLKEEVLRLRRSALGHDNSHNQAYADSQISSSTIPLIYVIAALLMGLIGIIMGKFLL